MGALVRVAISILLAMAGAFALFRMLPSLPFGQRLVLANEIASNRDYVSGAKSEQRLVGRTGIAVSPLRPAGIADIEGSRLDVVSDGAYIEAGSAIDVTRVDGNRIVVRRSTPRQEQTHD
jgi:membrane-bound serine protease (ClpP class)